MKETPTKVIFRKFRDGEVFALFPELPGTNDPFTCSSYAHVGQHGTASVMAAPGTIPAMPEDYASLKRELESATYNYNLRVVKRFTYSQYLKRKAAIKSVN